jgi:hypothetical protein
LTYFSSGKRMATATQSIDVTRWSMKDESAEPITVGSRLLKAIDSERQFCAADRQETDSPLSATACLLRPSILPAAFDPKAAIGGT